jgi:hypothetical protein
MDNERQIADINKTVEKINNTTSKMGQGLASLPIIDVSTLSSNPKPFTTPTMGSTAGNASSVVTSQVGTMSDMAKEQQRKVETAQTATTESASALRGYLDKLAGKGVAQVEAETEAGIPKLTQELTDITNQIEAKQLAARRQIEAVQSEAGLTKGQVNQRVQEINRQNAKELADLSIIQNARNRNLLTAQDLVNRKIDLEYGDLKDRIEAEKFFYQENKDDLTKAEQNLLNERIRQDERQYNEGVALEKTKQELIIQASSNQNVPLSVIQQAQRAKTPSEVASILAPYMVDELRQLQIAKAKMELGGVSDEPVTQPIALAQAQTNIQQINDLLQSGGIKSAVGTNFLSRAPQGFWGSLGAVATVIGIPSFIGGVWKKTTGQHQNFIAGVEQLQSQLSLDSLIQAKERGATFGALSDSELRVLSSSASKLGSWVKRDKSGNVIGYNTTEANLKRELDKINNFAKLDYLIKGGDPADVDVILMPNGKYVTKNSDGTYQELN